MEIQHNISLKPWHTFSTEARAKYFVRISNAEELDALIREKRFKSANVLWLGGGSNVLFTGDFDGMVIQLGLKGVEKVAEDENYVWLKIQAGENWDELVKYTVMNGWGGLENLAMIPGNAGTSPVQNIGAYGRELKDVFDHLYAYDLAEDNKVRFNKEDCRFGYRNSIFKHAYKNRVIITSVVLRLMKNPMIETAYGGLQKELDQMGVDKPGIADVEQAVRRIRTAKLPHPEKLGNAGSFFKNPLINADFHKKLKSRYPEMVTFQVEKDQYKVAAGWMIDYLGWRAYREGDAGVHEKQALVLVNYGKATGMEIFELSERIRESVKNKFGIELQAEVNIY